MEVRVLKKREIIKIGPYMSEKIRPENIVVIGAYDDFMPTGVMVISTNDELVASIEWIYVGTEYRRQGIANRLVEFAAEWAKENSMLIYCDYERDEVLNHIFIQNRFELKRRIYPDYKLTMADINRVFGNKEVPKLPYNIISIREANEKQLSKLIDDVDRNNTSPTIELSSWDLIDNDQTISKAIIKNDDITALLLIGREHDGKGVINFMWNSSGKPDAIIAMIVSAYKDTVKAGDIDTFEFLALENSVINIAEKFFKVTPYKKTEIIEAFYV